MSGNEDIEMQVRVWLEGRTTRQTMHSTGSFVPLAGRQGGICKGTLKPGCAISPDALSPPSLPQAFFNSKKKKAGVSGGQPRLVSSNRPRFPHSHCLLPAFLRTGEQLRQRDCIWHPRRLGYGATGVD